MKKQKVYMIGNAHLDPAWVWSWQEGSCEAKATIRSALDRMKEFPDFKFVCSSSSVYQWIEDFDSEMFEEMKARIQEGRFIVVGGWKVQPDCNLPSGENFARMSLYSQRYFKEKFGVMSKVGYNVDSFGHNAMMPQILRKSGMKYYVYMRPMEYEKSMEDNVFTWEAPDGSQVTAFRINEAYCKRFHSVEELEKYLDDCSNFYHGTEFMGYYGVGNHGGGPTIKNIQTIQEYNKKEDGKYELIMADPVEFFEEYENGHTMSVLKDELQHHASGCYSAVSEVKTLMRKGETKLSEAERYLVLTELLTGKAYSQEEIKKGWENLNFLTFHDIMGGCCIKKAYDDSLYMGYETISIAEKQKNSAAQTLSWKIDTTDKRYGLPIVLFNPHPFEVEEVVEINNSAVTVRDADGKELPFANVTCEALPVFNRDNAIFKAKIPAMGYKTYYFEPTGEFNRVDINKPMPTLMKTDVALENEYLKVAFDEKGNLVSVFDKANGKELLCGNSRADVIDETAHDTWSHGRNYFDNKIGETEFVKAEKIESNIIRETVKVTSRYGDSTVAQYYTLNAGENILRVRVKLNWNEKHKMLKFTFPVCCQNPTSIYEIPFGTIERPCNGEEESAQMWALVGDNNSGLAVLNDRKYSYSVKDNEISLTAIRSPIYCDHGLTRTEESNYTDQGIHEFFYALTPATTKDCVKLFRRALQFNINPTVVLENHHSGCLPLAYEGMSVDKENIVVSAFKKSEDGSGYIVRAYECDGQSTAARLDCKKLGAYDVTFAPYEIKTLLLKDGKAEEVLFTEYKE